ncbi:hypothetical protein C7N43_16665 [Sphingobacteriales bacterium UPWRP_1]|nr:hypothetical protein BVG80_05500 [Sphingobacteriales bacterium TSM_CSM]PSJ75909.1 hypothetical protein C7N43_16665 [Sphingobacteriales bacterium UPWRP_1]
MRLRWFGLIGMVAALCGFAADVLLLYVPNGEYEKWNYLFFEQISVNRIWLGHFIGVFCIPFELFGFWQVYKAVEQAGKRYVLPVLVPVIFVTVWGVAYHAMLGGMATLIHLGKRVHLRPDVFENSMGQLVSYMEPLGYLLFGIFVFISAGLFYLIRYKSTLYPRWVAWVNPFFFYLACVALYRLFPQHIGSMVMVSGFSLSIFGTLAVSTCVLWNR